MGQIFPTASLHRDHSISYVLVCEKELSHMGKNNRNPDLVCDKSILFVCGWDMKKMSIKSPIAFMRL